MAAVVRRTFVRYSSSSCPCRSMATRWSQLRHSSVKARCCYPCCCRASGKPFVRTSLIFQAAALFPTLGVQTNARVGACHRYQTATNGGPTTFCLGAASLGPSAANSLHSRHRSCAHAQAWLLGIMEAITNAFDHCERTFVGSCRKSKSLSRFRHMAGGAVLLRMPTRPSFFRGSCS